MKDNPWIEFLVFTRKERIAAIVLSSLIVITAIAPYFIPEKKFITPAPGEFEAFKQQLEKLKSNRTKPKFPGEVVRSVPDKAFLIQV